MKKRALLGLICFFPALLFPGQKLAEKDFPEPYKDWLKLTRHIILPVEKEVFLKLTSDGDRDTFIESFWKQRDPTPGTPVNEYRDEMVRRFAYVNKIFKRGSTREGWQTDMGRIYMILGPPMSIERFESSSFIVPSQAWSYYGDPKKSLPTHFILLFFQKGGVGDYKLYDPLSDGPAALLINKKDVDPGDYQALYERIREIAPTLADISISILPGEYNYDYSPLPRNSIIMADILESPKKDINPSYATHFMDYKGVVSTEYMTNFVESDSTIALIRDPVTGLDFLHFSIVPKALSVDFYEPKNQYYCNFQINVSLRVRERIILQYARDFPLYFPEEDVARVRANGISIEDSFPISDGEYRLIVLLQNSVGKEFSLLEKEIVVPLDDGHPRIAGPILGYRIENYSKDMHVPFTVVDKKIVLDPKNIFAASDEVALLFNVLNPTENLRLGGEVRIQIRGLRENKPVRKSAALRLADSRFGPILNLSFSLPAKELAPDYYELKLILSDADGSVLDEKTANFVLSPETAVPHPIAHAKTLQLANRFVYLYMLAGQADRMDENAKAASFFERAFALNPDYKDGLVEYAGFMIKTKQFDKALDLVERLLPDEKKRFDYYMLKGTAQMEKGDYVQAIASFQEGNKIYSSDVRLLNLLGRCYYRSGRKAQALGVLRSSLKLNPEQPDVKKLIAEIEK